MEVAFNPDYLADAIRFCGAERGRLWVRDGLKPALFEGPERRYDVWNRRWARRLRLDASAVM